MDDPSAESMVDLKDLLSVDATAALKEQRWAELSAVSKALLTAARRVVQRDEMSVGVLVSRKAAQKVSTKVGWMAG